MLVNKAQFHPPTLHMPLPTSQRSALNHCTSGLLLSGWSPAGPGAAPGTHCSASSPVLVTPIFTSQGAAQLSAVQSLLSDRAKGCTRTAASLQHPWTPDPANNREGPALPPFPFSNLMHRQLQTPSRLSSMPGRQRQGMKAAVRVCQQCRL